MNKNIGINVNERDKSWAMKPKHIPAIYNLSVYTVTWYNEDGSV